jgi:TusE/DsrC/DsvC family sulfur relay protein
MSETVELGGKMVDIDEDGFIQDPDVWDEAVALSLAKTEGVDELTETHWKLVNYLRNYYLEYNMAPMIRKLCKQTDLSLKEVYDLFPSGPAKGACKVAGLPKPTGCVGSGDGGASTFVEAPPPPPGGEGIGKRPKMPRDFGVGPMWECGCDEVRGPA